MIGKLHGTVDEIGENYIVLLTQGGVGYHVFLPACVRQKIVSGTTTTLAIYTHVREQEISLYGFSNFDERRIFLMLMSVSGIGPKAALNIIGFGGREKLIEAIQQQDNTYFSSITGIGKKTAQKILLELSNRFGTEFDAQKTGFTEEDQIILEALQKLGFKKQEALAALSKTQKEGSIEKRITNALKFLNK